MNARALAQEASSFYLSHLDPCSSHAENVKHYLRPVTLSLTRKLLFSPEPAPASAPCLELESSPVPSARKSESSNGHSNETEKKNESSNISSDWRDYLHRASTAQAEQDAARWNEQDQEVYDTLGRHTKARMDAFLAGCALALPDDPSSSKRSTSTGSANGSHHLLPSKPTTRNKSVPTKPASSEKGSDVSLATQALSGFRVSSSQSLKRASGSGGNSPTLAATTSYLRQISTSSSAVLYPQFRETDVVTKLELYIRSLNRVRTLGQECVVAMEPPRAVKARVYAIVKAFLATVSSVGSMSPVLTNLLHCLTKELLAVDTLGGDLITVIRRVVSDYEHQTSFASLAFLSSPEDSAKTHLTPLLLSYVKYLQSDWKNLVAECDLEHMLSTVIDARMRHMFKTIEFQSIGHLLEVCSGFRNELQHIELPPGAGGMSDDDVEARCADPNAIRQAVRDLQRETITVNGHVLPPAQSRSELVHLLSQAMNSRTLMHESERRSKRSNTVRHVESYPSISTLNKTDDDSSDFLVSSGNEGDTDGSSNPHQKRFAFTDKVRSTTKRRSSRRRSTFHLSTVDVLIRRLLVASSRTGGGGDAYFVVRDLFGGEDVEVVPSKSMPTYGGMTRGASIEMLVRLGSVTIKCHGSFDVYPKPLNNCREPLIQIHTTTTETICLHEVRACDSSDAANNTKQDHKNGDENGSSTGDKVLVLQEKKTDKTGWRTLSIMPALYEMVEVYNTPS